MEQDIDVCDSTPATLRSVNERATGDAAPTDSLSSLQAENEALRTELEGSPPATPGFDIRRFLAWVLALLAIALISLTVTVGWAKITLLDTDAFATVWNTALRVAHASVLVLVTSDGAIELIAGPQNIDDVLPAETVDAD
jgi:hypothetical protein